MSDVARILKEARDQGRLTALDFAQGIFDDFIELHATVISVTMVPLLVVLVV